MKIKAQIGDVFLVPLGSAGFGLGQVADKWNEELYLVAFDEAYPTADLEPKIVLGKIPFLAALSLDAKLWHGHWPIIGNVRENLALIPQPAFKVEQGGITRIESRDRAISRAARPDEVKLLRYRRIVAPAILERALKAHFGNETWDPTFEELKFDYAVESSKLLND